MIYSTSSAKWRSFLTFTKYCLETSHTRTDPAASCSDFVSTATTSEATFKECCCICFESLLSAGRQTLPCGHVLHENCVREMRRFGSVGRCPLCRQSSSSLTPMQELLEEASASHVRNANVECARLASEVLALDSDNAHANLLLGELLRTGEGVPKDLHRAIELLQTGRSTGHAECATQLGVVYSDLGRITMARKFCEEGRQRGDPRGATNLGVFAMEEGQDEQAAVFFQEAMDGGDADAFAFMGVLREVNDEDLAEAYYQIAWDLGSHKALYYLGALKKDQGKLDDAVRFLRLGRKKGDAWASSLLGEICLERTVACTTEKKDELLQNALTFYTEAWERGDDSVADKIAELQIALGHDHTPARHASNSASTYTDSMDSATLANACLSNALLESRCDMAKRQVILLTFSRHPQSYRSALLTAPELQHWMQALDCRKFPVELNGGAKAFVKVEDYEAVVNFIRLSKHRFGPKHIFVDPVLEDAVVSIIRSLPSKDNVYPTSSVTVPLNFAASVSESLHPKFRVAFLRTFIDVHVPNPSSTSSCEGCRRTVSTTDACSCNGRNPRRWHRPSQQ